MSIEGKIRPIRRKSLHEELAESIAEMIVAEARARPGELTLVTLGPLSNVAVALELEPTLPRLLRRLIMTVRSPAMPKRVTGSCKRMILPRCLPFRTWSQA